MGKYRCQTTPGKIKIHFLLQGKRSMDLKGKKLILEFDFYSTLSAAEILHFIR